MKAKLLTLGIAVVALFAYSCQKTLPSTPPPPKVNAGAPQTIVQPNSSAILSGSATDSASRIVGYMWSQISGPNTAIMPDDGAPSTVVSNLMVGTYVFQLMATDSLGQVGVGTVTITVVAAKTPTSNTVTLTTVFPGTGYSPYELMYLGNSTEFNPGFSQSPELLAETWTINGIEVWGRSFFKFNMSPIPGGVTVKTATLYLFSDTIPDNGDLAHANYGPTNDFWIMRVDSPWNSSVGWNNFPPSDTAGAVHVPQTSQSFLNLSLDVTTMVNNMIAGGNNGFEMKLNTEQIYNSRIFCSTSYPDSTRHPYMIVTY